MKTLSRHMALVGLLLCCFFLAIYNLDTYPGTWLDEGFHLLAAKKLALEGKYRFGPAVGPTVFVPIAAAFRLMGVGLWQARAVMVVYYMFTVAAFYGLARYLAGWKVAAVATLLFVSSPETHLLWLGRQVMGEVPATLFLLLGALIWLKTVGGETSGRSPVRLVVAGTLFGLAILTKNHLMLWLPAWVLLWLFDRWFFRQLRHSDLVLPLVSAIVVVAAWYVGQWLFFRAGSQLAAYNVQQWASAPARGTLAFSLPLIMGAIKFLTKDAFDAWALPALLYGVVLSLRRSRAGLRWALPALVAMTWLGWFVLLSVGWARYAFPALTLIALFVAKFFHDVTGGYELPVRALWAKLKTGHLDIMLAGRAILIGFLVLILFRSMQGRVVNVLADGDDSPQQMAAYIMDNLPEDAEIETIDPEICFLSGRKCHFPPSEIFDATIRHAYYDGPSPADYYDFQEYASPYLLIGGYGGFIQLYAPDIVERDYDLLKSIDRYALYRAKAH